MFQVTVNWNPQQARLKQIIVKPEYIEETAALLQKMHSLVHTAVVYGGTQLTYMDEVISGLNELAFRTMPTVKDVTVAWNIWHITRIEDIVANILIADGQQVLNDEWLKRLGVLVKDTGNAMTDEEIIRFSNAVDKGALLEYRFAVGRRTREILTTLTSEILKRKIRKEQLYRILDEGGVIDHPQSKWLLNFWGKKTVAGLCQMPVTRHQIVHLNDCMKLKQKCSRLK